MIFLNMCINLDVNPINSQLNFLGYLTPPCDLKELLYLGDVISIVATLESVVILSESFLNHQFYYCVATFISNHGPHKAFIRVIDLF